LRFAAIVAKKFLTHRAHPKYWSNVEMSVETVKYWNKPAKAVELWARPAYLVS